MRKLRMRPQARVDLLEVWHYVAKDSIDAANRVYEEIKRVIRNLRQFPGVGHMRRDAADPSLRFTSAFSWIIAYRFDDEEVIVTRIIHGHRDFRREFDGGKA